MNLVEFKLTDGQLKKLAPLFNKAKINQGCAIIFQPFEDGRIKGGYIPPKYATQIQGIISKIKPEK